MGVLRALAVIVAGAVLLRVLAGVAFANYDTLYALAWGGQLAQGETPAYGVPIAPTPHPLLEALGVVLRPLEPARRDRGGRGARASSRWRRAAG